LRDIRKAIVKKDEYILLKDGSMGLLPEDWVQKYAHVLSLGEVKSEEIRISKLQFSLLDDLLVDITEDEIRQEIKEKKKRFLHFDAMEEVPLPLGIQASLRDYQLAGYQWLHFLHKYKWGGCLADDMGLGKTIQIITFLSSVLLPEQPHLIVVPTTLLFNWEQELQKFAPHLTYHIWHSVREKDTSHFKNFDLILSTYGVISSDIEQLKEIAFNYIVLDESQAIKNPLSLRYKSAIQLKGINKLVMTGTPIENNIFDLYAQMNFVNPGLLGSVEMFRNQFVTKLERQDSVNDNRLLKGLIKPFILRRTKEQVLKELPSKTEITLYCEMEKEQRDVYETFRKRIQEDLLEKAQESGMSKIGIYIIDGLLKLRQICNSPAILNTEVDYGHESVKLNELMRNITEKTGKHKVLVFSQFVKMLQQVVPALEAANIPYCYLDGQTSNRSKVVNEFVHNEEKRVFLISLKSGGFGLNLTVADYVFLIDPWWNPAVENQAIDRVHRIGQDKKVFAYRMICKDTIEEKIMLIQQKKKQLSTEIISSESSFIKNLKKEDLMFLLS
jgi:non-specific serine/threonine protein kinase